MLSNSEVQGLENSMFQNGNYDNLFQSEKSSLELQPQVEMDRDDKDSRIADEDTARQQLLRIESESHVLCWRS